MYRTYKVDNVPYPEIRNNTKIHLPLAGATYHVDCLQEGLNLFIRSLSEAGERILG